METLSKFYIPGALLVLTLGFGFWVSSAGKPYNGALFNVHKLLALAAVVLAVVQFVKTIKGIDSPAWIIILLVAAALCAIALFASGAFLSIGNLDYGMLLVIHRVAIGVLVAAVALLAWLLWRMR
jgi:hypothetical protein